MIVRDLGDAWQIVLQTDHAALSGQFAAAWGNGTFAAPRPARSVQIATVRHDDGWAVWERAPNLIAPADGGPRRPRTFIEVPVRSHVAFYRAHIAAIVEQDPYAGLLVS